MIGDIIKVNGSTEEDIDPLFNRGVETKGDIIAFIFAVVAMSVMWYDMATDLQNEVSIGLATIVSITLILLIWRTGVIFAYVIFGLILLIGTSYVLGTLVNVMIV